MIARLVVVLSVALAACGAAKADGPPQIEYGRDVCVRCAMIIEDARFAAAYRLEDGTEKKFDDVGDLLLHGEFFGELDLAGTTVWVSDFDDATLIDASTASYVPTLAVASPMGHSILAFADRQRAEQVADEFGADVIDWETVLELPVADGLVGHHHEGAR